MERKETDLGNDGITVKGTGQAIRKAFGILRSAGFKIDYEISTGKWIISPKEEAFSPGYGEKGSKTETSTSKTQETGA